MYDWDNFWGGFFTYLIISVVCGTISALAKIFFGRDK